MISVLLPARNAGSTLGPAIRSVLQQTHENFELLLLDDRSEDDTVQIAQQFRDDRIRILQAEGEAGLVARLNQGITAASGILIARMDADDLCFPERFEKQVMALEADPALDLIGSRALAFNEQGEPIGLLPFRDTHHAICARPWLGFYLAHPTWMGRADWFRRHTYRLPEVKRAEDQELLLRAMPMSRYGALTDVLLGYRCRPLPAKALRMARFNWLMAQLSTFRRRGQLTSYACAVAAYGCRSLVDIGVNPVQRISRSTHEELSPHDVQRFFTLLSRTSS